RGYVRRALSVMKKRNGAHELTIREMRMSSRGIEIGPPLTNFQGILSGIPTLLGAKDELPRENNLASASEIHGR
ncbi:MAG TPA: hypothetical protein VGF52_04955, partial [Tepidisphaeraceae bacterium]